MEITRNVSMSIYNKIIILVEPYINTTYEADEIIKGLYIGGLTSACNYAALRNRKINNVVTVIYGAYKPVPADIICKIIHAHDSPYFDLSDYFEEAIDFIDEKISQGEKVLVHCMCGVSRSTAIVIAYLIKKKDIL
jgi:hypothetical protein